MDDRTAARICLILCAVAVPVLSVEIAELFRREWTITVAIPIACLGLALVSGAFAWTTRNDPAK
jgi:TRAP-type C4-dicarboxylate transport system permease small subunit